MNLDLLVTTVFFTSFLSFCSLTYHEIKLYGAKHGSIVLASEQLLKGIKVTSIVWKRNQDKAAEWYEGDDQPSYYGIFNSTTTTLDMNTWTLTISNLLPHFDGKYSAEVNYKDPIQILNLAIIDTVPVYGIKGQPITLKPKLPNVHVVSAQWTLNSTVIALWDGGEPVSHGNLLLDIETFYLTILELQPNHTGVYVFSVNDMKTAVSYLLTVKDTTLELSITRQCNSTTCTLNCTGDHNENIEVSWTDSKGGKESGPALVVERSEHLDVIFTCTSDSGSWKPKSILEREVFSDYSVSGNTESNLGIILGSIGAVIFLVVGVAVCLKKKVRWLLRRMRNNTTQSPHDPQRHSFLAKQPSQHPA